MTALVAGSTGPVLMVFALVVGFPIVFMLSGALVAIALGHVLWRDGEKRFPRDERVELNR